HPPERCAARLPRSRPQAQRQQDPPAGDLRHRPTQAASILSRRSSEMRYHETNGNARMTARRWWTRWAVLLAAMALVLTPPAANAQLKVVTSTTDLYDIAKAVGGDRVEASHIGEGYQDPHFVEA